ncbi:MAG: YeeE/YedE family protein [Polyangiaceae bacterium]|jgi:hypothetical protein|nr:YeeE/YedE family protein [Polyangiaceae bacterium]
MRANLSAALGGLLFGLGLGVAGMTRPEKVLGFLDVAGAWDASLAFVMIGGIAVHATLYRLIRRRPSPLFDVRFHVPDRRDLDRPLLVGAALFGAGWGLAGYCPGPGLVSAAAGRPEALLFVAAMTFGMLLQHAAARRPGGVAPPPREPAGPAPHAPSPQGG